MGQPVSYSQLKLEEERQFSIYNFELADIDMLRSLFQQYQKEAERLLDHNLYLPAYDYVLKCSHAFNILDARKAISVAERTALMGIMRNLAARIAQKYVHADRRGQPWLICFLNWGSRRSPAFAVSGIRDQLRDLFRPAWPRTSIAHGDVECAATNRRLMVHVAQIPEKTASKEETVLGPAKRIALDERGLPTVALKKFCEFQKVKLTDVVEIETPKGKYLGITRTGGGHGRGRAARRRPSRPSCPG